MIDLLLKRFSFENRFPFHSEANVITFFHGAAESDNFKRFVRILANTEIGKHCTMFHDHLLHPVLNTLYIRGFLSIINSKMDNSGFQIDALLCRHWNEI